MEREGTGGQPMDVDVNVDLTVDADAGRCQGWKRGRSETSQTS